MSDESKKKSADRCLKFGPATYRTFAIGIDLIGWSAANSPQVLARVLENEKIQKKLADELKRAGEELMKQQRGGKPLSLDTTMGKLGSTAGEVLKKPLVREVKNSAKYKKLQASLNQTKCAFDHTPVGVFVNENKTLLIVVGSVAAIGGGVAMYRAKAGDVPAKAYSLLPLLTPRKIGAVDLTLKDLKLVPSKREVSADVSASGKWKNVQANLELGATFANDALTRAAGKGSLILTFSPEWQGSASGSFSWSKEDADARRVIRGSAAVDARKRLSNNANLTVQLFGNYANDDKALTKQAGVRSDLVVNEAMGNDTRLTLSPSYSAKVTQARGSHGRGAARTDHRIYLNLKLEFH